MLNQLGYFASTHIGELTDGDPVALTQTFYRQFGGGIFGGDNMPSHVPSSAMLAPHMTKPILEFDPSTATVQPTGISLGDSAEFLWDGGNLFGRVMYSTVEIFNKDLGAWRRLQMPRMPSDAQILLLRTFGKAQAEIAIFVPGYGAPDRILSWHEGMGDFRTVAQDQIARAVVSPSHKDIYGYFDLSGRFRSVSDQTRSPQIEFWLKNFSRMNGLIDFGFLDQGHAAVVKTEDGTHASKTAVLAEKNLKEVQELRALCANVSRGVQSSVHDGNNYLFAPPPNGRELVVYLHGGPVNVIGREGSWISDIFTLSGHPVGHQLYEERWQFQS